jgi:hypothetical protein
MAASELWPFAPSVLRIKALTGGAMANATPDPNGIETSSKQQIV